jgi:hypothetical protein
MSPRTKNPTKTRHIRLPVELDKWVEETASKERRTYNGQIVYFLEMLKMNVKAKGEG